MVDLVRVWVRVRVRAAKGVKQLLGSEVVELVVRE